MAEPELRFAHELPVLLWRAATPWLAISSGPHGGGIGLRHWVLNAMVPLDYRRDDPEVHVAEIADELGLTGAGTGLLTAVDVRTVVTVTDSGATAHVTTGIGGLPTWAAAPEPARAPSPGTINAVCLLPQRLIDGALVNVVATVAEAKAQALAEAGVPGTGTCTDATVVLCPADGPAQHYGGPRSVAGSALARAVHAAIRTGLRAGAP